MSWTHPADAAYTFVTVIDRAAALTDAGFDVTSTRDLDEDAMGQAIDRTAILETVRTGASGIGRGERILRV